MTVEPEHAIVQFPGGIRLTARWAGSGRGPSVFALSESGADLTEHGAIVDEAFEELCRAELRIETPAGAWAVRLASRIADTPRGLYWDDPGQLVVGYGFHTYAFEARSGVLAWQHRSATPLVALLGSSRLGHVIVQAEIETFALEADGAVGWRLAHSDVVVAADLVGGHLVVTSYGGQVAAFDPATGRTAG